MSERGWARESWDGGGEEARAALPRVEDLPVAENGYDRAAVEAAFDAFYRHAAQIDASLRVLESVDAFSSQARELRADLRDLRAASWGPLPGARPAWTPATGAWEATTERLADGVGASLPRIALEAAFLIIAPVLAALAGLPSLLIVATGIAAFVLVAVFELVASARRTVVRPGLLAAPVEAEAERAPPATAPEVGAATMIEAPPAADDAPAEAVEEAAPEPAAAIAEAVPAEPAAPEQLAEALAAPPEAWQERVAPEPEPEAAFAAPEPEPEPEAAAPEPEAEAAPPQPAEVELAAAASPPAELPAREPADEPEMSEPVGAPIEAAAELVPEPEGHRDGPAAAEPEPAPDAALSEPRRRWFRRHREPEADAQRELELSLDQAVASEQAHAAWEADRQPVVDPWEAQPEAAVASVDRVDSGNGDAPQLAPPQRRAAPRFRRGRR